MSKKSLLSCAIIFLCISLYSHSYRSKELIPADHWIYDAIYEIALENGSITLADTAPLSVEEISFYLSQYDYESLSDHGKNTYDRIYDYLDSEYYTLDLHPVKLGFNFYATPELLYKSNDQIDWTFATSYTGNSYTEYTLDDSNNIQSSVVQSDVGMGSFYSNNSLARPLGTVPIYLDFGDLIYIETDPYFAKNFWSMSDDDNFSNIPLAISDVDFLWPKTAYLSTGYHFDSGWGLNMQLSRSGFQYGRTLTGSIVYNNTFETDMYCNMALYSKNFKYSLNVVEVNNDRFLYLHSIQAVLAKKLKISVLEGTFINDSFELRYLNPLMIMHSYGSWMQYCTEEERQYYREAHVCAYFALTGEFVPVKNLRLYFLFAQNELETGDELKSVYGQSLPNGIGLQGGLEYILPDNNLGKWTFGLEGVYTSPYLYVKQGKDWSLISYRTNMLRSKYTNIYSWIGSPFGPDCLAAEAKVSYNKKEQWGFDLSYLFVAHGENSFAMFDSEYTNNDGTWWAYYPSVLRLLGILSDEEARDMARDMWLTGTIQYTNQVTVSGFWQINKHFKIDASIVYSVILNAYNQQNNFQQGVQLSTGFEYKLF